MNNEDNAHIVQGTRRYGKSIINQETIQINLMSKLYCSDPSKDKEFIDHCLEQLDEEHAKELIKLLLQNKEELINNLIKIAQSNGKLQVENAITKLQRE